MLSMYYIGDMIAFRGKIGEIVSVSETMFGTDHVVVIFDNGELFTVEESELDEIEFVECAA